MQTNIAYKISAPKKTYPYLVVILFLFFLFFARGKSDNFVGETAVPTGEIGKSSYYNIAPKTMGMIYGSITEEPKIAVQDPAHRFLIIGDSFMAVNGSVGEPMEKQLLSLKGSSVKRVGKVKSGLVDVSFFDWYKESEKLFTSYKPDFVIVLLGNNDVKSFKRKTAAGEIDFYEFGTEKWEKAYRQKVRDFLKTFDKEGVTVYWIGLSMMRDEVFSTQIKKLNDIYEEEIKNFKNVQFVPIWDLLSDGKGKYTKFLPDDKGTYHATRMDDGIHLTYFSGSIVTAEFIRELGAKISLQPNSENQ